MIKTRSSIDIMRVIIFSLSVNNPYLKAHFSIKQLGIKSRFYPTGLNLSSNEYGTEYYADCNRSIE